MNPRIPVDELDLKLLSLLQHDAAVSNQALAEALGISPATSLRRVRRLAEAGVIERTVAVLSPEALGHGLTAIVEITLDHQSAERLGAFEACAVAEATVQQCYRINGGPDFVLIAQFNNDSNVRNVRCFFSVHRAKCGLEIPLPILPAAPNAPGA